MADGVCLFTGAANPALAQAIARVLDVTVGASGVDRFPDGELTVHLLESVRRKEIFIIQTTAPPVNDNLVELLAFADTCWRASAAQVCAGSHLRARPLRGRAMRHVVLQQTHRDRPQGDRILPCASSRTVSTPMKCRVQFAD